MNKLPTETTKHSKIGASSMERWQHCPGSVALASKYPNLPSAYAEEGTLAHTMASEWLLGKEPSNNADEEMRGYVKEYVDLMQSMWEELNHTDDKFLVEHSFDLSSIFPDLYGTADCVIYDGKNKILHVCDFKYGAGIAVSPVNNAQLLYYGVGALMTLNLPVKQIQLHIIQPRCEMDEPIKSWETTPMDVMEFIADLKIYAEATTKKDAPLVPGDHCRFCPAKLECPALAKNAQEVAKMDFANELAVVENKLTPAEIGKYLDRIPLLESWIKGVYDFAFQEALHGRTPVGYKLVAKQARRKWIDVNTAQAKLNNEINANIMRDCMTDPELKSPAQVEKIVGKTNKDLIASLVSKVSSGETLVQITDTRPAVNKNPKAEFLDESLENLLS